MRSSGVDARDPYSARRRRRAAARQEVWQTVRDLAASGTTVLLTKPYLAMAEQLADRIAILHQRDRSGYRRYGAPAVVPLVQNLAAGDALLLRAEVVAYLDR